MKIDTKNHYLYIFSAIDHFCVYANTIEARKHTHSHIQISISIDAPITIIYHDKNIQTKGIIIDSNISHELQAFEKNQILFLIDSSSTIAQIIKSKLLKENSIYIIPEECIILIASFFKIQDLNSKITYHNFLNNFYNILGINYTNIVLAKDSRIENILHEIEICNDINHSLSHFAKKVNLSESRFSHVFKDTVGISFSSYIINHALEKALFFSMHGNSITESALKAGFDSPSHLSYTCAKILGMTPRQLSKVSRFLKV